MDDGERDDLERVLAAGTDWVGREYTRRTRKSLQHIRDARGNGERDVDAEPPDDDWIESIVFLGEELPDEVYFDVIVAAIDEAHGDDDVLWCIADGPVDHFVWRDLAMGERLRDRRGDPNVDRMFTSMQHYLRGIGYLDGSWWADDFVPKPRRPPGR